MDSSTVICWTRPFVILGISGLCCRFYSIFDGNVDLDQTPHNVASDLGLFAYDPFRVKNRPLLEGLHPLGKQMASQKCWSLL